MTVPLVAGMVEEFFLWLNLDPQKQNWGKNSNTNSFISQVIPKHTSEEGGEVR